MAGSIGNLSLKLSANSEALVAGLEAARKKVQTFVGTSIVSLKRMTNVPGMIEDAFKGTLGSILDTDSVFSQIDAIAKLSDRLNLSTESLTGFQYAADLSGVTTSQLTTAFEGLTKILGNASAAGDRSGLSLERFGLNARELADMSLDDAVLKISDAYLRLPRGIDRSSLAVAAFGRSGLAIQKFLETGPEGLRALAKEAEHFGLSFSRVDAAGIEMARDAVTKLGSVFEGVKRQLAVQIAPIIGTVAEKMAEWAKSGPSIVDVFKNVGKVLRAMMQGIVNITLQIAETLASVINKVAALKNKAGGAVDSANTFGEKVGKWTGLQWLGEKITGHKQVKAQPMGGAGGGGDLIDMGMFARARAGAGNFFADFDARAAQAAAAIEDIRLNPVFGTAAVADATAFIDALQGQLAGLDGLTQTDKMIVDITSSIEALKAKEADNWFGLNKGTLDNLNQLTLQLEAIKSLDAQIGRTKYLQGLKSEAEQLTKSFETPFDTFESKTAKMRELLKEGFIDWETFRRGVNQAGDALDKATGARDIASPAAIEQGTAAAFSAVNQATRRAAEGPNDRVVKVLAEEAKRQKERDDKQLRALRDIADGLGLGDLLPP